MKTQTSKEIVAANAEALKGMNLKALFQFSRDNGMDSRAGFTAFKKALLTIGIDWDEMKSASADAREEKLASSIHHTVTLFVDAKARCQRFAICDSTGKVIWYGRFFDDDKSFIYGDRNEQSACECAAARKAIWLASKIGEAAGATAIRLNLIVDAQWLVTLSGKAAVLADDARRFNIKLVMEWIEGTQNPADGWTTADGFKKWNDNDLAALALPYDAAAEQAAAEQEEAAQAERDRLAGIEAEKRATEAAAQRLADAKAAGFETVEAHDADKARVAAESAKVAEVEKAKVELERCESRIKIGRRFGTEKPITTFHQFDGCIGTLNRLRSTLGMEPLTAEQIATLKAIQNFTNEIATEIK